MCPRTTRKGTSTFHPIKDTYGYITLVIRTVTWFNPLKVFMPLALFVGLVGFGRLIYDLITQPLHVTPSAVILIIMHDFQPIFQVVDA